MPAGRLPAQEMDGYTPVQAFSLARSRISSSFLMIENGSADRLCRCST